MGEAKRRGAKAPTLPERAWRWTNRVWLAYPRPLRAYFKFNTQLLIGMAFVLGGLFAAALVVDAFIKR